MMSFPMSSTTTADTLLHLTRELENFEEIARYLLPSPGDIPRLPGVDIHGGTIALNGALGGDHIIYVDFKQRFDLPARIEHATALGQVEVAANLQRCQHMAGLVVIDVSGHRATDALLAAMLHQALLLGSLYELDRFGHITNRLFENLNTRFYKSSGAHKFISLIYGEISDEAEFRFLSAGQPGPAVFSHEHDRFMEVAPVSFPPLGMLPSLGVIDRLTTTSPLGFKDNYERNEWSLMGTGDILLLHTDGLAEHGRGDERYFPAHLEACLRHVKRGSAAAIFDAVRDDVLAFAEPVDDISVIVIKRTR
jgi:serine phosphatase RsbU (regulator of sigma subunit)